MYQKILSVRFKVLGICFLLLFALILQPITLEAQLGHRTKTPKDFKFDFDRWPYPLHAEVNARLQELARKYPKLARTHIICRTLKGRDLTVMEITNKDTGPGTSKPGMWMDANIHAGEETGRLYLMYFIERLLFEYGKNPDVTRLVDTRTFYVLPVFDADGGERVLTQHPAWPGHKPEEHDGKDLDGDGYITQIRVKDDSAEAGYRYYTEGVNIEQPGTRRGNRGIGLRQRNELTGETEETDFNRNWSGNWAPQQSGAGPYPFSQPEVRAVAEFITTSHKNIFFCLSIHSGGGGSEGRSYLVRPIMDEPYDHMHHEDNDFYVRTGFVWADVSGGMSMQNTYYDFLYNTSQEDAEGKQRGYGPTAYGYMDDYIYLHVGIHCVLPEISGSGIDYDGDDYFTWPERERWRMEQGNRFFSPWMPYNHPILGEVEIGGPHRIPAIGERAKSDSEIMYDWNLYVANLSPLLRIKEVTAEPISGGKYRVVAAVKNEGCLSTYVTRQAIKISRDYPVMAKIQVSGGKVVDGEELKGLGHILGKWAYIRDWIAGQDRSTKTVEWTIEPTGSGPLKVSVETWAPRAGRDQRTITFNK